MFEAIGLVILVVFVFLQNWRATLIPLLTVPVAIVGTFALFPLLGFSINMTSMFGLVLAIGIVVDDAIVVVEAVQRHIDEGMAPRAGRHPGHGGSVRAGGGHRLHSGGGVHPGGVPGRHQRPDLQAVRAHHRGFGADLGFQRALAEPRAERHAAAAEDADARPAGRFFGGFNRGFEWTREPLPGGVGALIRKSALALLGLFCFWFAAGALFRQLPAGFLPDEDQGTIYRLHPPSRRRLGASAPTRPRARSRRSSARFPGVAGTFTLGGLDIATRTSNSNVATVITRLKPWDERTAPDTQFAARFSRACSASSPRVPEAITFAFGLPPILGLSTTGGFQFMLEDRAGGDVDDLAQAADLMVAGRPRSARSSATWSAPSAPTFPPTRWTWTWTRSRPWAFPSPTPTTRCRLFSAACT